MLKFRFISMYMLLIRVVSRCRLPLILYKYPRDSVDLPLFRDLHVKHIAFQPYRLLTKKNRLLKKKSKINALHSFVCPSSVLASVMR